MCAIRRCWRRWKKSSKLLNNKLRLEHRLRSMFSEQFDKFCQTALFIGAEVVMDVPTQIILSKFVIVFGACANDGLECILAEIARFTELTAQRGILDSPAKGPHCIDEGQLGHLIPRCAEVPDLMLMSSQNEIERGIANQQGVIRE